MRIQCLSPLRSLCYLLFKTSSVASVGEALGFWRDDSINRASGMTKAAAATSANPVPQSPLFTLLPSVQILFDCFCAGDDRVIAHYPNEVEGAEAEGARFPYLEK